MLSLWVAAATAVAAGPANACSLSLTPFSQRIDSADLAFHGRAEVRIESSSPIGDGGDEAQGRLFEGTVRFSAIDCYAPPPGERLCPRSLTVPFVAIEDGVNCPSWVLHHGQRRYRYFTLGRDEGRWQLGGAWRKYDRP